MTKAQLKEQYTKWNKDISALGEEKDEIFHKLQDLCAEKGDGRKWCGIEKLVEELTKTGHIHNAMNLVSKYYEICGKEEALRDFAIATNNFEI